MTIRSTGDPGNMSPGQPPGPGSPKALKKLIFNFTPQNIAAGNHHLRFDVKTSDGTETAVTLPFIVR